jgi:hypothetical protein
MRSALSLAIPAALVVAFARLVGACSGAPSDARIGVVAPDLAQFKPVADIMGDSCGSLDCHGSPQRNLIVYGCEGLRLETPDGAAPGCVRMVGRLEGTDTTDAEYEATYRSLVGLEPAVMTAVVQGKGRYPELLTVVRKARGEEAHKGGAVWAAGSWQDQCIATWLARSDTTDACTAPTDAGAP